MQDAAEQRASTDARKSLPPPRNSKPKTQTARGSKPAQNQQKQGQPTVSQTGAQGARRRKRGQKKKPQPQQKEQDGAFNVKPSVEDDSKVPQNAVDETSATTHHCLICCDPIKLFSLGVCNHRSICSTCSLRRRELYKQFECCLCKADLKEVVFTASDEVLFEELDLPGMIYDAKRGVFFDNKEAAAEVNKIFALSCSSCRETFGSLAALQKHLTHQHNLSFCDICLQHKKAFLHEQTLYSPNDLEKHKKGIGENEMERHQLCEFCRKLHYDKDDLYQHLTHDHETCHICEKDGIRYQYFRNYKSLEEHFRTQHYLCEEPQCLEQRFVVFRSALDLKAHDVTTHLANRNLSKSEAKAARTLDAAVLFGDPRPRSEERGGRRRGNRRDEPFVFSPGPGLGGSSSTTTSRTTASSEPSTQSSRRKGKKSNASDTHPGRDKWGDSSNGKYEGVEVEDLSRLQPQVEVLNQSISKEERQARNKVLIDKILAFLGPERFDGFKRLSAELRLSRITPAQYYKRFMDTFGWNKASELFPELVDLLPDPVLRAALLVLHKNAVPSDYPKYPTTLLRDGGENADLPPLPSKQSGGDQSRPPVRPFMKTATNSGPPPWSGAATPSLPVIRSSEDFPSLPPTQGRGGSALGDDGYYGYDEFYPNDASYEVSLDAPDRFHASASKGKKKKGKQKQMLLQFG